MHVRGIMSKEKTVRFLTVIVVYCIAFTSVLHTTGVIMAILWKDADLLDRVLYYATWTYGGELLMTALIRLLGDKRDANGSVGKTLSD